MSLPTDLTEHLKPEGRPSSVDPKDPYLTKQLIAYIGNKRSLLPFLQNAFLSLVPDPCNARFIDPFAGSGSVARLARYLGFEVHSNDWEFYSWIITTCYLTINSRDINRLFGGAGGVQKIYDLLNSGDTGPYEPYFSLHYAPRSTNNADYHSERLFYTRENAVFLDRIRSWIERNYPGWEQNGDGFLEKSILITSLLYEASTHANTSGVFKACHKGFGGHGKDALGRILSPMHLDMPVLIDRPARSQAYRMDARAFSSGRTADICYLDPPYTVHQYGSNYFMLNSVALWDRPEVSSERTANGRFMEKAGIRKDWKSTKSEYCSRKTASGAFTQLLSGIDSRYILLSYNTEGIVPIDELIEIMSSRGEVRIVSQDYTKYRGGKQSLHRIISNMELLLITDTSVCRIRNNYAGIEKTLLVQSVAALMKQSFSPRRMQAAFSHDGNGRLYIDQTDREGAPAARSTGPLTLTTVQYHTVIAIQPELIHLGTRDLEMLKEKLVECLCRNRLEECEVLLEILNTDLPLSERRVYWRRFLVAFKKTAFRKYRTEFTLIREKIQTAIRTDPSRFGGLAEGLSRILAIAELRFNG